jgi:putative membrane protein
VATWCDLLVRAAVLLANAVGLIVAAVVLDDMRLSASAFVLAVVVSTVALALMQPFLVSQLRRRGSAVLGGGALIATLAALVITAIATNGLEIDGALTWLAAAVIVWAAALVAAFVLPFLGLRRHLETREARSR